MDSSNTTKSTGERFLRWEQVEEKCGLSRSHSHTLAREGKFPKPIKIGPRASAWLESEINAWIAERIEASRTPAAA